jgi:predicted Zn finger-like uncharacterized protein
MIIECINCKKKFKVNSDLIPVSGRSIQCGSCNYTWFFKKDVQNHEKPKILKEEIKLEKKTNNIKKKGSEIIKYHETKNFTFGRLLSFIVVLIISFIALIIILDTFKSPLYELAPNLEFILFNFYETLKDIKLFIKDLT